MTNCQDDVRPMVTDALLANDLTTTENTPEWRRLCRMALIVAARAHEINAKRKWGDYSDGWPQSAGVPTSKLPESAGGGGIITLAVLPASKMRRRLSPQPASMRAIMTCRTSVPREAVCGLCSITSTPQPKAVNAAFCRAGSRCHWRRLPVCSAGEQQRTGAGIGDNGDAADGQDRSSFVVR